MNAASISPAINFSEATSGGKLNSSPMILLILVFVRMSSAKARDPLPSRPIETSPGQRLQVPTHFASVKQPQRLVTYGAQSHDAWVFGFVADASLNERGGHARCGIAQQLEIFYAAGTSVAVAG